MNTRRNHDFDGNARSAEVAEMERVRDAVFFCILNRLTGVVSVVMGIGDDEVFHYAHYTKRGCS